ncbi:hypothetical protein D3C75_325090 [compost metagenome]
MDGTVILNEPEEIDTLVKMIKMAYAFDNWKKVLTLSNKLLNAANKILLTETKHLVKLDRHIAYYFGYSYLMKGLAFQKVEKYPNSFECIAHYSNLEWLDDETEECKKIINDFRSFAVANTLTLEILNGNRNKLKDYVTFLEENPDQILSGLITILESSLAFSYSVDEELASLMRHIKDPSHYEKQVISAKYLLLYYLLACYKYTNGICNEAVDLILHTMIQADKKNNDSYFKKSVALFEVLKSNASDSQLSEYSIILNKIFKGENEYEKSTYSRSHFIKSTKQ